MMNSKPSLLPLWLSFAAASIVLLPTSTVRAQSAPAKPASGSAVPSEPAADPGSKADRAKSYFHASMAEIYEEEAATSGKPEYVTHAVEEYKDALNADPGSAELNDALAELYFRTGKVHEAEATARGLLKTVSQQH